jgi:hypothetical protein
LEALEEEEEEEEDLLEEEEEEELELLEERNEGVSLRASSHNIAAKTHDTEGG